MKPVNWKIVQGDTLNLRITYKDPLGNPINLSGYSVIFQVKDQPGGNVVCATAQLGNGITVDIPNGIIDVHLTSAQTKKFTVPKAAYQLQVDPGSDATTIAIGWFEVQKGVI